MRKHLFSVLVLIAAIAPVAARDYDDDAKAIVEKAIKAQGDLKATKALLNTISKGKGSINIAGETAEFSFERWLSHPGKEKTAMQIKIMDQELAITQLLVGDKGWTTVMGMTMPMEDDEIKESKTKLFQEYLTYLYPLLDEKGVNIHFDGEKKNGDKTELVIKVTKKDVPDMKMYFDKSNYMLVKTETEGKDPVTKNKVNEITHMSGFKEFVPGVKVATKYVVYHGEEKFLEFELSALRAVPQHEANVFAKPE